MEFGAYLGQEEIHVVRNVEAIRASSYYSRLYTALKVWRGSRSKASVHFNLSGVFLNEYWKSLVEFDRHIEFCMAFEQLKADFDLIPASRKDNVAFPSLEVLSTALDQFNPDICTKEQLATVAIISGNMMTHELLALVARRLLEQVIYNQEADVALSRVGDLCNVMASLVLGNDRFPDDQNMVYASRIYQSLTYFYRLRLSVPPNVSRLYRIVEYGYWGVSAYAQEWGIVDVERFVDISYWIDNVLDEMANIFHYRRVYQAMTQRYTIEVATLAVSGILRDDDLRRYNLRMLYLRSSDKYLADPITTQRHRELAGRYRGMEKDDKYFKEVALTYLDTRDMRYAQRVADVTGIDLVLIGRSFETRDFYVLRDLIEDGIDIFSNRSTELEVCARLLLVRRAQLEGAVAVAIWIGGRFKHYRLGTSVAEELQGLDPSVILLVLLTPLYRRANALRPSKNGTAIIDSEEAFHMLTSFVLLEVKDIPWEIDCLVDAISDDCSTEELFERWRRSLRESLRYTISPAGDRYCFREDLNICRYLGIRQMTFQWEDGVLGTVDIGFDNSIVRFIIDLNFRILLRGERTIQDALMKEELLETEFSQEVAEWYGLLIYSGLYDIISGDADRRNVRTEKDQVTSALLASERSLHSRRGHIRHLERLGHRFTEEQRLQVLDIIGLRLEQLAEALGHPYFTFVLPTEGKDGKGMKIIRI